MKANVKCSDFRIVTNAIKERNSSFDAYLNEFRCEWGKVFSAELKEEYAATCAAIKGGNVALKEARYELECILAKVKGLTLSKEEKDIILQMKYDTGMSFKDINLAYIATALSGTKYLNGETGELLESRLNKMTKEREMLPVQKWTLNKVGRYIRLAYSLNCARVEVVKVMGEL